MASGFRSCRRGRVFPRHNAWVERLETRQLLASAALGVGTGLIGNYFSDQNLGNLAVTRVDPTVNFDWGLGAPDPSMPTDNFSVRWTGKVQAQNSQTYTFYTQTDEGVALWVNGQQIIDNFTDHTLAEDSGTISLQAGELYDIRMDYYDNQFQAAAKLLWSSPSTLKQIIPSSQLYADAGWTSSAPLNAGIGGAAGSIRSIGQIYTLAGGGGGLDADQEQLLYQTLQGDGTVIAQVTAQDVGDAGAQSGLMIRDSLAGGSALAALAVSPGRAPEFDYRVSSGDGLTAGGSNGVGSGNDWLKLQRDGNFIRAYASSSGADGSWQLVGTRNIPMDHTAEVGFFTTSANPGVLIHATFRNFSVTPTVPLGAGLDAVRDYSFGQVFVDVVKQARAFQGPNLGPQVATDANGWPMADFMTILVSGFVNQGHILNGDYKVSFTGQATIGAWLTPGGQILNQVYNAATNTTTCDLIVNAPDSQDNWYIALQCTNTRRNPGDAPGTGITHLRVIRPGYDPGTNQTFTAPYLQFLQQFSVLRFMDWTATNNSAVVNWSDRTLPTAAEQSGTKGVAWEYVAQLANQLHKDLWINIPAMASDDYVQNLATLLKNNLDPDRVVYVEYSNEVWNGIFDQYTQNLNAATAEVNAGNSPLNADGSTNPIYWGWRRTALRTKQIGDIFASVWGQPAINARVRAVLAAQQSNLDVLKQGIEFLARTYGAPNQFLWGVAAAPYFSAHSVDNSNPSLTVDQYLAALQSSVNNQQYFNFDSYARRYGLANMTYEGGSDTMGANNVATKYATSMDPRFQNLVEQYLNAWYADGGGLFDWFVAGPTNWNTPFGSWGTSPELDITSTPKTRALTDVAMTPRKPLTFGLSVPAVIDARAIAGAPVPFATTYLSDPGTGKSFDYFLRAPRAGAYQIRFSGGTIDSGEQLRFAVNGTDVRTVTMNNTGALTAFGDNVVGTFQLEEGMNLLHVTSVSEGAGWNIQTISVTAAPAPSAVPTVAVPAGVSQTVITGTSASLSVLGADANGESTLSYSWEAVNRQPLGVTFSINGSNAAKNTTATFTQAGTYQLRCTISDGISSVTSSVNVTVNQAITSVTVTPAGTVLANGEQRQFSAVVKDQFGVQMYTQPAVAWSVDSGFGTIDSGGLYTAPASGLGTATVRATAPGGVSGSTSVVTQSPQPADNPANAVPGLQYSYFQGSWSSLPNFDNLTPVKTGLVSNLTLSPAQSSDHFGFQFTGYVFVPGSGTYTFYTTSDDGSKLWVGGSLVVNNDGAHSARERSGTIILDGGWHQFKVAYFEASGGSVLTASYSGPGLAGKMQIPNSALERVDIAPTILTPPSANPSEVTGKTADLSVVGADESGESALTYLWSTPSAPAGAPAPSFSINGSNAAKTSAVTFSRAGTYTLQIAISDGTLTTTAPLQVVVDQTLTSLSVSPSDATTPPGGQIQFSAIAHDQFDNLIPSPQVNWSAQVNGGSIDANGLYTAPALPGSYTIMASAGTISADATASVVAEGGPTVARPAQASPNPVTGTAASLSVLGADEALSETALTYTWATTGTPPAPVTFSSNGDNTSKNATAIFSRAGTYQFVVTISDGTSSVTSSTSVVVQQTFTRISMSPSAAIMPQGSSLQFTATGIDQFGRAMSPPPSFSWSVSSTGVAGTITQSGLYTAPTSGTPTDTIIATSAGLQATAKVTVSEASQPALFTQDTDIGAPAIPGSMTAGNGVFTLTASGADIWNSSDSFHFTYQPLSGDGQVIARIASMQFPGGTVPRAKAGLMMRESLASNARNVMIELSPDNSTTMQNRMTTGGGTGTLANVGSSPTPYWLKLVRSGNTFTGYRSPDAANWTQVAGTTISMPKTIYFGLATNSHDNTQLVTSTFDHVSAAGSFSAPVNVSASMLSAAVSTGSGALFSPATASDGDLSTYFQSSRADGAWLGFDFGSKRTIDLIEFAPRDRYAFRLVGGKFEASNTPDFHGKVVTLYTIRAAPRTGGMVSVHIRRPTPFRYVRYVAPAGSFGNIAEVRFQGT